MAGRARSLATWSLPRLSRDKEDEEDEEAAAEEEEEEEEEAAGDADAAEARSVVRVAA